MPRNGTIHVKINALRQFIRQEKRFPGYNEMLRLFAFHSKNSVHGLLLRLEKLGYLRKQHRKIAWTGKLIGAIKLIGTVQAGFPSPAEEELADTLSLDEFLVQRPEATYMLTVSGDSMSEAGILPGDIVLVEKGVTPKNNDIVIAQVDEEWTLKYFTQDELGVKLIPANRKYTAIRPRRSLTIGGVVRAVLRKYRS